MTDTDIEESFKDFVPTIVRKRASDPSYPVMRSRTDEDRQDLVAEYILGYTFAEMLEMATALADVLGKEPFDLAKALNQWATQRKASQ